MPEAIKLTEQEWRDRDDLRKHWADFCDADPVPPDFIDRMEDAGLASLRRVTREDLRDDPFAADRGIEKGGYLWELTAAGRAVLAEGGHDAD